MNDRQLADLALTAALLGSAAIQREIRGAALDVETKNSATQPIDFVTSADKAAEAAILDAVSTVRPDDAVLAEESGSRDGTTGVRWVVDPLDGTMNFVHGLRDYAVSVGVERSREIVAGALVRPADGEWAVAGDGYLAGRDGPPSISATENLGDVMLGIGMPRELPERLRVHAFVGELLGRIRDFRRSGSSACSLLEVAYGRNDVYLGFDVNLWDVAGGAALVEAAGGITQWVTTASGLSVFVAGAPAVTHEMIDLVKEL